MRQRRVLRCHVTSFRWKKRLSQRFSRCRRRSLREAASGGDQPLRPPACYSWPLLLLLRRSRGAGWSCRSGAPGRSRTAGSSSRPGSRRPPRFGSRRSSCRRPRPRSMAATSCFMFFPFVMFVSPVGVSAFAVRSHQERGPGAPRDDRPLSRGAPARGGSRESRGLSPAGHDLSRGATPAGARPDEPAGVESAKERRRTRGPSTRSSRDTGSSRDVKAERCSVGFGGAAASYSTVAEPSGDALEAPPASH